MATRNKKKASDEDVIAMRDFWTGGQQVATVHQSDPDPEVFHNPHMAQACNCREVRVRRGIKYCVKCWPLPGDREPEPWEDMMNRLMAQRTPHPDSDARIEAFLNRGTND